MHAAEARPGRWRTGEASKQRILEAARGLFGQRGYDKTTVRAIAAQAQVDPAMVHYFFATKSKLFAIAMGLPLQTPERLSAQLDAGIENLGERLVVHFMHLLESSDTLEPILALMRSAPTDDQSASMLAEFIEHEFVARVRDVIGGPDAALRAELVGSLLLGLTMARFVIRLEPLASASTETIASWVGPSAQRYISGDLDSV